MPRVHDWLGRLMVPKGCAERFYRRRELPDLDPYVVQAYSIYWWLHGPVSCPLEVVLLVRSSRPVYQLLTDPAILTRTIEVRLLVGSPSRSSGSRRSWAISNAVPQGVPSISQPPRGLCRNSTSRHLLCAKHFCGWCPGSGKPRASSGGSHGLRIVSYALPRRSLEEASRRRGHDGVVLGL